MSQEIEYGEYKIYEPVGNGGCGSVFAAVNKINNDDGKAYILKTLNEYKITKMNIKHLQGEIDILEELNKPPRNEYIPVLYASDKNNYQQEKTNIEDKNRNIINIESKKEYDLIKERPYYVIDFYSCGNLFYYLEKKKDGFSEKLAKVLFKKIVLAIQFCHQKNICHLDIKPDNIAINKDFEPIIIDFGFSEKFINPDDDLEGNKGSRCYKCPEMIEKYKFRPVEADIFSLGVVLFNLVTGKPGFFTSNKDDRYYKYIYQKNYEIYWQSLKTVIKDVSQEFKNLYIQMVSYTSFERPTIAQILASEWMREINDLNEEERMKLEKEVKDELKKIYKDIKNDNVEIQVAKKIGGLGYSTRSGGDDSKTFAKNCNLKPKKIDNDTIIFNHHIIINGSINEISFMNSLVNEINKKYEGRIFISASNSKLKFSVLIDNDDDDDENVDKNDEEENNCSINIELFKYEDGRYLLEFLRTGGDVPDYYKNFLELREIIRKIL